MSIRERFMKYLQLIFLISFLLFPACAVSALPDVLRWNPVEEESKAVDEVPTDVPSGFNEARVVSHKDTIPADPNRNWWHLFKKGKLEMKDTTVRWPGFLGFCVDVYNWGDRIFSSTDTNYVVGTGKRWRTRIINDNWTDSYYMRLPKRLSTIMSGQLHILLGASIQYMAVSYTYSFDMSHLISGGPINYKKQEFGFNCARFSLDAYYYSNDGGTYIRTFGDYNKKKPFKLPFKGVSMSTFGIDGYYFLNGYKYSQGAAYNFSKIQKRSQGCFMVGFSYCNQDIDIDFTRLPEELKPYTNTDSLDNYRFHYHDYNLLFGYGYNCVLGPHWLFNVTALPGIGFNHCYEDSSEGSVKLLSIGGRGMMSFTYNNGNWFAGLQGNVRGNWYNSKKYSLFNAVESFIISAGFRF